MTYAYLEFLRNEDAYSCNLSIPWWWLQFQGDYLFTVSTFSLQPLLHRDWLDTTIIFRTVTFLEQLLFQSSTFFSACIFSEEPLFQDKASTKQPVASTKQPVASWAKLIGSCSWKPLFWRTNLFIIKISTEYFSCKSIIVQSHIIDIHLIVKQLNLINLI